MSQGGEFTDEEARAAWNLGARGWQAFLGTGADYYRQEVHGPGLLRACEPLQGTDALDLGCGEGFFTRELARRGARVVGVDLAEAQIANARAHEARAPLGIEYHLMSAAEVGARWPAGRFALVTACMSLQDMADAGAALRGAFAVLPPGGRMVFSVPHPASGPAYREWERDASGAKLYLKVDRYFESGPDVTHWNMPRLTEHWATPYRRYTLEEWSALVAEAGFLVRRLYEPHPTPEQVRRNPALDDCARFPYFLVFDLVKPG